MKHSFYSIVVMMVCLQCIALLTGCKKIIDWGQDNFKQVDVYAKDITKSMQQFIRTTRIHHQFATVATFDALFLTDKARKLYMDYYTQRHLISDEQRSVKLQRLLNENKYYVSFYVMGSQFENRYINNKALFKGEYHKLPPLLGDKDAAWQVRLRVDGKEYPAESIHVVDLPVEYRHFFGSKFSQFKSTYMLRFDAVDEHDQPILPAGKHDVQLLFRSVDHQDDLFWQAIEL